MKQQILARVLRSPRLPSLPTIAIEVIDLVQQKDVNIKQIATTVENDPALSSKILKTANSSFYGQVHAISTVSHALVVLGLNSVKTLTLGFSLVSNLQGSGDEGFDYQAFWRRSLFSAAAARVLAWHVGVVQQEECVLGSLLQDLGVLAMHQTLGETYEEVVSQAGADHPRLYLCEREVLGTDHAEVGGMLADHWHLPPLLAEPIRFHEDPANAPQDLLPLVRCVALSGRAADVFVSPSPGDALETYRRLAADWFGLGPAQAEPLLKSIHKGTVEMHRLFDISDAGMGNPDEVLARAREALEQLSLQQQRQADQLQEQRSRLEQERLDLEERNRQLIAQASTDSLTGTANRRAFNDFVAKQFDATRQGADPMAILFLDTDHFKNVNDTYGHQVGDRVLVTLAKLLHELAPSGAMVARYGGEEFAIVIPGMDRVEAARQAERTRHAIEAAAVPLDEGEDLSITVSIGVAAYEGAFFGRVEQVINAADQAAYAAKGAGRNCVRVFTPRPRAAAVA